MISVHAYPFFGFLFSAELTCHLEVTGIGKFYHQRFHVNRLLVFIGASVLRGSLKLHNTYT